MSCKKRKIIEWLAYDVSPHSHPACLSTVCVCMCVREIDDTTNNVSKHLQLSYLLSDREEKARVSSCSSSSFISYCLLSTPSSTPIRLKCSLDFMSTRVWIYEPLGLMSFYRCSCRLFNIISVFPTHFLLFCRHTWPICPHISPVFFPAFILPSVHTTAAVLLF